MYSDQVINVPGPRDEEGGWGRVGIYGRIDLFLLESTTTTKIFVVHCGQLSSKGREEKGFELKY